MDRDFMQSRLPANRLRKFVVAGVAMVGAGAMAVTPVTPITTAVDDVRQAAVNLSAAANPFTLVQESITETLTNLKLLGINSANSSAGLSAAFEAANPFAELANIFSANASDPSELRTRLANFEATYGDDLRIAFYGREDDPATAANEAYDGVFDRLKEAIEGFGPTLTNILTYDPESNIKGVFTQAVYEANFYFVLNILDTLRPLIGATPAGIVPLFSIPGDFLGGEVAGGYEGALPGVSRIDNLINVINEQTFVRAITGPFQTVAFQVAQSLDDTLAAMQSGNILDAIGELVVLPIKAVNAFVNGFTPSFSTCNTPGCSAEWPSLIDPATPAPGVLQYTLVTFKNQIITALGGTPPETQTTLPSSTDVSLLAANRVAPESAPEISPAAADPVVEAAPEPEVVEPVVTETTAVEPVAETTAVEPVVDTPVVENPAVEPVVETPAVDETPASGDVTPTSLVTESDEEDEEGGSDSSTVVANDDDDDDAGSGSTDTTSGSGAGADDGSGSGAGADDGSGSGANDAGDNDGGDAGSGGGDE